MRGGWMGPRRPRGAWMRGLGVGGVDSAWER